MFNSHILVFFLFHCLRQHKKHILCEWHLESITRERLIMCTCGWIVLFSLLLLSKCLILAFGNISIQNRDSSIYKKSNCGKTLNSNESIKSDKSPSHRHSVCLFFTLFPFFVIYFILHPVVFRASRLYSFCSYSFFFLLIFNDFYCKAFLKPLNYQTFRFLIDNDIIYNSLLYTMLLNACRAVHSILLFCL